MNRKDPCEDVKQRLDAITDPLTGKGLFAAGRITGLEAGEGKVSFTLEAPAEAVSRYVPIRDAAEAAARAVTGVKSVIAVLTAHEAKPSKAGGIDGVKHVIAVASAKGGVGKSTVAVNLACAFAAMGLKTGLLDLDVYGPSAPTLLGIANRKPQPGPDKTILPIDAFGLKSMSIGYLVDASSAMIWRGAMATSAVRQMLDDVVWGELDVLLLDLPPGTGDVQLTLLQRVPLAGAIIISTPQEMALADVRRGLAMFDKTHAPILGVIENMAYFETPDFKRTHIFGEGGARRTAAQAGVPFLGEIPIDVALRESADLGRPLRRRRARRGGLHAFPRNRRRGLRQHRAAQQTRAVDQSHLTMRYQGRLDWFNVDHHGFAHVRGQLGDINVLCRALLRVVDRQPGEVLTLAPSETPLERLYQFERGGLLAGDPDAAEPTKVTAATSQGYFEPGASLRDEQAAWLGDELGAVGDGVCIIDDVNPRWSDLLARQPAQNIARAFGVGDEVYHLVTRGDGVAALAHDLDVGFALWHGVAAICSARPRITDRASTEVELAHAAASAVAITCPAYDGEGFLAWRRK